MWAKCARNNLPVQGQVTIDAYLLPIEVFGNFKGRGAKFKVERVAEAVCRICGDDQGFKAHGCSFYGSSCCYGGFTNAAFPCENDCSHDDVSDAGMFSSECCLLFLWRAFLVV